jgi:hypothetical protein
VNALSLQAPGHPCKLVRTLIKSSPRPRPTSSPLLTTAKDPLLSGRWGARTAIYQSFVLRIGSRKLRRSRCSRIPCMSCRYNPRRSTHNSVRRSRLLPRLAVRLSFCPVSGHAISPPGQAIQRRRTSCQLFRFQHKYRIVAVSISISRKLITSPPCKTFSAIGSVELDRTPSYQSHGRLRAHPLSPRYT